MSQQIVNTLSIKEHTEYLQKFNTYLVTTKFQNIFENQYYIHSLTIVQLKINYKITKIKQANKRMLGNYKNTLLK